MTVLVTIQIGVGMVVSLFATIPAHHSGANPANYFCGSARSVAWALGSSPLALASRTVPRSDPLRDSGGAGVRYSVGEISQAGYVGMDFLGPPGVGAAVRDDCPPQH